MQKIFAHFAREEHGHVTMDWAVLMSGIILMGISVVLTVTTPDNEIAGDAIQMVAPAEGQLPS